MRLKGVVFDFNGTLFWDSDKNEAAWRLMARKYAGRAVTDAEFLKLHGVPNEGTVSYFLGRAATAKEVYDISEEKENIYRAMCLDDRQALTLAPGAKEMLDEMAARGIARAIATSCNLGNLNFYFEHLGLGKWFDRAHIVFNDGARPGKPAPDFYLAAAKSLQIAPPDLAAVEDSATGLQSARAAGFGLLVSLGPGVRGERDATPIDDFYAWHAWYYGPDPTD